MIKLVLIDDESNKELVLATDSEVHDFYTILEDVEFYYNDLLCETQDINSLNAKREKLQNAVSEFLYKNLD